MVGTIEPLSVQCPLPIALGDSWDHHSCDHLEIVILKADSKTRELPGKNEWKGHIFHMEQSELL